jgi:ubiquinone/menaquinone biosynthesis C-methylase UbiE
VDFLFDVFEQVCGREPKSFVELGCGPAQHSLEMAESGLNVFAVDKSSAMLDYSRQLANADDVSVTFLEQDMRSLQLPVRAPPAPPWAIVPFSSAFCPGFY